MEKPHWDALSSTEHFMRWRFMCALNYSYHRERLKDWTSCCLEWQICWCVHVFSPKFSLRLLSSITVWDVDDPHTAAQSAWIPQPRPPETSDDSRMLAKTINIQGVVPLPGEFASRTIIQWGIKYLSCPIRSGFWLRSPSATTTHQNIIKMDYTKLFPTRMEKFSLFVHSRVSPFSSVQRRNNPSVATKKLFLIQEAFDFNLEEIGNFRKALLAIY